MEYPITNETPPNTVTDSFKVDPTPPLWKSLPVLLLTLPVTFILGSLMFLLCSVSIPVYRNRSLEWRDRWAKRLAAVTLYATHIYVRFTDHNNDISEHAKIYVAPHICMLEATMLCQKVGHLRPIAAAMSKDVPLFGAIVEALDPIYVHRKTNDNKTNVKSVVELFRESLETTSYRHLVFPEGTYTNGNNLIQFRSGAFVPGLPVTPVIFHYSGYIPYWNRKESNLWVQIYRLVSRIFTRVDVEILKTVMPNKAEQSDPKLFAKNIRELIARHSNRPLSNQVLTDSPNYKMDLSNNKS
jgi:lysophosphatidylcholine acyltransferase/lyso-PAF acetyltransferase